VEAALIKAISAIHRSDSLDGFERAFLQNVSAAIEADAFGLYLLDAQRKAPEKIVATGAPRVFLEEYENYRDLDPIYDFVMRHRGVADGAHLLGARDWQSHPLRQWMQHWGLRHSLQGALVIKGEVAGTVNFARGAACRPFNARTRWMAQVVCEEAGAALERLLQSRDTATQLELLSSCFDSVPMPLVITDFRGEVRALNRRAKTESSPEAGQQVNPLCRVAHVVSELATSSKQTLEVQTDGGDTYMSMRLSGCEALFLSAWTAKAGRSRDVLESLPQRSREVAELLIQGKQNKWIAWKLGISRHTIKYHVRRVYSLLGVSSRLELVRLASGGVRARCPARQ
jgi:DNA-binding CsgD family transcriptional regulator